MAYQITYSDRGSIVECSGVFTMQDLHKANGALHGHERFEKHTYQIWNLLNADLSQITEEEMIEPAATDHAAELSVPKMKVALIVRDAHAAKLCESYRENIAEFGTMWKCQLFDSMNEAQEWVIS